MVKKRHRHPPDPAAQTVPIDEMAKQLGISTTSIYTAIKAGQIPASRIGSRYLVGRKVLDRLLRQAGCIEAD